MSGQPKLKNLLTGLVFLLLALQILSAQKMTVRHYGVADGLTNEWISDIAQDSAGFLWIATQYGLNRFDGRTFRTYTYRPDETSGPPANWTKRLLVSGPDELWLGSLGRGLNRMDTRTESFDQPTPELGWPDFRIVDDLLEDKYGRRYLATAAGLYVQASTDAPPQLLLRDRIHYLAQFPNGTVVGGGRQGVRFLSSTDTSQVTELPTRAMLPLGPDSLVLITDNEFRLLERRGGTWTTSPWRFPVSTQDSDFYLPRFAKGSDRYWLAAGSSVWSFNPDLTDLRELRPGDVLGDAFTDTQVHLVFFDHEDGMWWGTDRGAFLLRPAPAFQEPLRETHPELPGAVREIVVAGDVRWLATTSGIFRVVANGVAKRVSTASVNALHLSSDGLFVYAMIEGQLTRFIAATGARDVRFRPDDNYEGPDQCWRIIEDLGGRLWITRWETISCFDPTTNKLTDFHLTTEDSVSSLGIFDLMIDQADRLWIATLLHGALRVDDVSKVRPDQTLSPTVFRHDAAQSGSLSSDVILQIHQAADRSIWMTTDGGLNRYRPATGDFQRFLRGPGLTDDKFVSITSGPASELWLGSISHGIFHFDPIAERFTAYGTGEGLASNAMLISSVFRQPDGGLWFGGQDGLQFFRPHLIRARAQVQSPLIRWLNWQRYRSDTILTVQLPQGGRSEQNRITLDAEDNVVHWSFAAISFRQPERTVYQFRLAGYHDDWLPATPTGELTLSNLPPGKYTLHVRAANPAAGWATTHPPLFVRVFPAWYRSGLAYLAYGLLFCALLYGGYRALVTRKLAQARLDWFDRIAHEFRTPLAVISGAVDRFRHGPTADQQDQVALIDRQTNYLSRQVERIMELAELRSTAPELSETVADFSTFHRYLLQSFSLLAEEKGIELEWVGPEKEKALIFSFAEDAWRKVSSNLLANAIKFTPTGGRVTLAVSARELKGGRVEITVSVTDTGVGMGANFQRRLFRPFAREDEKVPGTGLGLALSRELADRMGVNIRLHSRAGEGSSFVLSLPAVTLLSSTTPPAPATAPTEDERPHLLVAEDHVELQEYLRYCLAGAYQLTFVADGNAAWEHCLARVPDLVLTDQMMPGRTGLELLHLINGDPVTDHIPVVMLTAKAGDAARLVAVETGAAAYLTKPFRRPELLAILSGIFERQTRLHARYQGSALTSEPPTVKTDVFVLAVTAAIEARLSDEDFSVEALAEAVNLSRAQLFRKLKALTGITPTFFLTRMRLSAARHALRTSDQTVAEIAYAHGYRDPAYFARVYRKMFGERPSDER